MSRAMSLQKIRTQRSFKDMSIIFKCMSTKIDYENLPWDWMQTLWAQKCCKTLLTSGQSRRRVCCLSRLVFRLLRMGVLLIFNWGCRSTCRKQHRQKTKNAQFRMSIFVSTGRIIWFIRKLIDLACSCQEMVGNRGNRNGEEDLRVKKEQSTKWSLLLSFAAANVALWAKSSVLALSTTISGNSVFAVDIEYLLRQGPESGDSVHHSPQMAQEVADLNDPPSNKPPESESLTFLSCFCIASLLHSSQLLTSLSTSVSSLTCFPPLSHLWRARTIHIYTGFLSV